jgi:hypothetical protein
MRSVFGVNYFLGKSEVPAEVVLKVCSEETAGLGLNCIPFDKSMILHEHL